ncbi:hypothetical protein Daura_00240 [Dactylosporangium aurantiacum]|uniref:WD40 repeat protein n=1 Tax=Dactylosporangium aurantiacum TaxID=35754 RepID=A0A9Q9MFS4_9ACTN|nr:hypothetical protein [Dactylosporangium aurantiacum]MDG6101205.1 hypothetical protein [Dactylosporangium aurantiacum]UWZ54774.1 hypothetical protein Daura_00240 [Dactylosporangium aurantiacum]
MRNHIVTAACVAATLAALTGCGAGQSLTTPGTTAAVPAGSTGPSESPPVAASRPGGFPGTLFYASPTGEHPKYALQRLDGGRLVDLIAAERTYSAMVSPDGARIAFVDGTDLWVTDGTGANGRKLGTGFADVGYEPAWSPAGDRLLVAKTAGSGEVTPGIVTVATGAFAALPHDPHGIHYIWSADGQHLGYATGVCEIGIADANGGGARLVPGVKSCDPLSISPDGTKMAVDVILPGQDAGDIGPNRTADAIIDMSTGKAIAIPVSGTVTQVFFRPDSTALVRASTGGTVTLTLLSAGGTVVASTTEPAVAGKAILVGYV